MERPTILELMPRIDQAHLCFRHLLTLLLRDHVLDIADGRALVNVVESDRFTINTLDKECRDEEVLLIVLHDGIWCSDFGQGHKVDSGILDAIY